MPDKDKLVQAIGEAAGLFAAQSVMRFESEFPNPSRRDIDVGLAFEARALREAAEAIDRRRERLLA